MEEEKFTKTIIENAACGKIEYEESFWTGKKKLSINGEELTKANKKTFSSADGRTFTIEGNYLVGAKLNSGEEKIQLTSPIKWYEIALSILPFILILIWGNNETLCLIVPVVGGAIGGAISALTSFANAIIIKGLKPIWLKIAVSILTLGLTFLICYAIGLAVINILY